MVNKLSDVSDIVKQTINDPGQSFPAIMKLATSEDWKEREVAATILVEGSKKKPGDIVAEMILWADHANPNVRRTASEGRNANTAWIIKDGLRKLKAKYPEKVEKIITTQSVKHNNYPK